MKPNLDCDICRGAGVIRLPVYHQLSMRTFVANGETIPEPSRTFPCPECAGTVSEDRIRTFEAFVRVDDRYANEPAAIAGARRDAAHSIVAKMLDEGAVQFTERRDPLEMWIVIRATVSAVSMRTVASMTRRIRERQMEIATRVVAAARRSISNWGSHYTNDSGPISKAQAIDAVSEAMRQVETEEPV